MPSKNIPPQPILALCVTLGKKPLFNDVRRGALHRARVVMLPNWRVCRAPLFNDVRRGALHAPML